MNFLERILHRSGSPAPTTIWGVVWSSLSLPTQTGEHVIATKNETVFRIACAGRDRWTVTVKDDEGELFATLELLGESYRFQTTATRSATVGSDWRELLAAIRPR